MNEGCFAFCAVIALMIWAAFSVLNAAGWEQDTKYWREETVKRGVAEWVLDPVTGETYWKWKES